ncbi:MAG TPA: hypothetical protein VL742_15615 [Casimicrobiaceae bacterium]|nr:hypothetical protein [Casimicrobiaceae bacterium]
MADGTNGYDMYKASAAGPTSGARGSIGGISRRRFISVTDGFRIGLSARRGDLRRARWLRAMLRRPIDPHPTAVGVRRDKAALSSG